MGLVLDREVVADFTVYVQPVLIFFTLCLLLAVLIVVVVLYRDLKAHAHPTRTQPPIPAEPAEETQKTKKTVKKSKPIATPTPGSRSHTPGTTPTTSVTAGAHTVPSSNPGYVVIDLQAEEKAREMMGDSEQKADEKDQKEPKPVRKSAKKKKNDTVAELVAAVAPAITKRHRPSKSKRKNFATGAYAALSTKSDSTLPSQTDPDTTGTP